MRLRLYLDTSVISACVDERTPERLEETRGFWKRLGEFDVTTSDLVRQEIGRTGDDAQRSAMLELLSSTREITVSEQARDLATQYVQRGLFGPTMYDDALHMAIAVLDRQDILVSWNFRHLVNRRKRAQVSEVNALMGLPSIEILAPSEL
jgi:predicted nucleic acid-binding protein